MFEIAITLEGAQVKPAQANSPIKTVQQHILESQRVHRPGATGEFSWLLSAITLATKIIEAQVRRAGVIDVLGETGESNVQGERVKKLDEIAKQIHDQAKDAPGMEAALQAVLYAKLDAPKEERTQNFLQAILAH